MRTPPGEAPSPPSPSASRAREAFTLVELLVACAVFALMLVLMAVAISQMSSGIRTTSAKVEAFAGAREGFAAVNRTLSTATLNTYWDYFIWDPTATYNISLGTNSTGNISTYGRQSDLYFLITNLGGNPYSASLNPLTTVTHGIFFFSPLGYSSNTAVTNPPGTLNPCGFFVAYGYDPNQVALSNNPFYPNTTLKPRFRLYQWMNSSGSSNGINTSSGCFTNQAWITPTNNTVSPLAENIIAIVFRVPDTNAAIATNYGWDSGTSWPRHTNQPSQMNELPPFVEVTMVAVDEAAVNRLAGTAPDAATALSNLGISSPGGTAFANLFTDPTKYTTDIASLTGALNSKKVPYRVFTTIVPLPGSKWSP